MVFTTMRIIPMNIRISNDTFDIMMGYVIIRVGVCNNYNWDNYNYAVI